MWIGIIEGKYYISATPIYIIDMTKKEFMFRGRYALVVAVIFLILVPSVIYGAIAANLIPNPINPNLGTRADGGTGKASGIIYNVAPELMEFHSEDGSGTWTTRTINVAIFKGIALDLNGYRDIKFVNITIYDPYLRPYTTISWEGDGGRIGDRPDLDFPETDSRNFRVDNGKIAVWHNSTGLRDSEGMLNFQAVYTFGSGIIPGTYSVDAYVADESNTVGRYIIDRTIFIIGEIPIKLYRGWNLVSLPLYPTSRLTASQLLEAVPYSVKISMWDESTQRYITHLKNVPFNDFNIIYGSSYFIKVTRDVTVSFTGTETDETTPPVTKGDNILYKTYMLPEYKTSIKAGWNICSIPYHLRTLTVDEFLANFTGIDHVVLWDAQIQRYISIGRNTIEASKQLPLGRGFYVLDYYDENWALTSVRSANPPPVEV